MNSRTFQLAGVPLSALASGALWWPDERVLCVSDLHLGKSDRIARRTGAMLPPYETADTLARLDADIARTRPETVICLGDSFDDDDAAEMIGDEPLLWLLRLQAGRRWIWVEGNHDPGRLAPGGTHRGEIALGPLTFRHIAAGAGTGEVSGHYHPKAVVSGRAGRVSRPCFLYDGDRVILPAYGTYTGGLRWNDPALIALLAPEARAILTGSTVLELPVPASKAVAS